VPKLCNQVRVFCEPKDLCDGRGLQKSFASLRVCDYFDVAKNRYCQQNSNDDKIAKNSKSHKLSG